MLDPSWFDRVRTLRTMVSMAMRPALDMIQVDDDLLALASALHDLAHVPPYRSLRERTIDRVAGLYRSTSTVKHLTPTGVPVFQVVVATTPPSDPNAFTLSAVSIVWMPAVAKDVAPSLDLLYMAVSLWQPTSPNPRFSRFSSCFETASRLASVSVKASSPRPFSAPDDSVPSPLNES